MTTPAHQRAREIVERVLQLAPYMSAKETGGTHFDIAVAEVHTAITAALGELQHALAAKEAVCEQLHARVKELEGSYESLEQPSPLKNVPSTASDGTGEA